MQIPSPKKIISKLTLYIIGLCLLNVPSFAQDDTPVVDSLSAHDLMGMTLEEILNIKALSTTLTETENDLSPVPVVIISQTDIELSGARNLDELLEIYVPGFIMMYKGSEGGALGVRGIISDRNNKVLLLVNGKIMNGRALKGALSERFLTMLNDIERIEVIQSPQSSLYGPGAISSVINIYTKSGKTEGAENEVQVNQGLVDYFTNIQLRHSNKINNDLSYSIYYGGDYATGTSLDNSPIKYTYNETDGNGDTIIADQPITHQSSNNLNGSYHNQPRHKAHAQLDYKDWSTWVRFTNGGVNYFPYQGFVINRDNSTLDSTTLRYSHLTTFTNYKNKWGKWEIDARLSYDQYSKHIQRGTEDLSNKFGEPARSNKETEIYSRVIFKYETNKLSIAAGPAVSFEKFGLPAYGLSEHEWSYNNNIQGFNYDTSLSDSANAYSVAWSTAMLSGIGEVKYSLKKNINLVAGLRVDKHTYTRMMVSPKASIVWKPKTNHLVRFQYSRSNRRQDDADLRRGFLASGEDDGEVESISFYELSGDIGVHKKVVVRPSIYYSDYDVVSWGGTISESVGKVKYYGGELTMIYKGSKSYGQISHNYIKISDFSEVESIRNNVSASAYGFGNSFAGYPDHLTKLFYRYKINKKMSVNTSLQITWYLQGAEDYATYNNDTTYNAKPVLAFDLSDGNNTSHKPSAYLHAGYVYKFTNKLKASIFAYNLLGLFNENLNKRVEFQRTSMYRIQPVSFALRLDYDF